MYRSTQATTRPFVSHRDPLHQSRQQMSVAACFESVLIVEIHQVASVLGARAASSPVQFIGVIRESDEISDTVVVADDTSSITVNISVADRFAAPTGTLVRVCGHVGFTVRHARA